MGRLEWWLEFGGCSGVAPGPPVLQAGALLRELNSRSLRRPDPLRTSNLAWLSGRPAR